MRIDKDLCANCGVCYYYCPLGAIEQQADGMMINEDECVECGVCLRRADCPTGALHEPAETSEWPRVVRKVFSNPSAPHTTGVFGRGTEEVKTNDVTGRVRRGQVGVSLEIGRPGVGARLSEAEKFTVSLVQAGVKFEPKNPLSQIMDATTGKIREDLLGEKVLSAIIEFAVSEAEFPKIFESVVEAARHVGTAFSWGAITRVDEKCAAPVLDYLKKRGVAVRPCAKINLGMGKPIAEE